MIKIYCIEDINDIRYIGSTKRNLNTRLNEHRYKNNRSRSKQLNLYNCIIYTLEECEENLRKEREYFWINKLECVNRQNGKYNAREVSARKYKENPQKQIEIQKKYYYKNREKILEKQKIKYNNRSGC